MSRGATPSARLADDVLVLDVGNSKTLGVLFCAGEEHFRWRVDYGDGNPSWSRQARQALRASLALSSARVPVWVASVAPRRSRVLERGARRLGWRMVRSLSHEDSWPMRLDVRRPDRLGVDRIANVAGMMALGLRHGVVVDAGTAITIDVLRGARHVGGLILPGARLWSGALHAHTAQLPRVGWQAAAALIGQDTRGALRAGLRYGLAGAVRAIVKALRGELGASSPVLFTGGDGEALHDACALRSARWEPDLVVLGVRLVARSTR